MENYEKKYNNALERARGFYNNEECRVGMTPIDLEVIFPELAESEDDLTWLTKYIEEEAYSLSLDIRDDEDSIRLKKLQKAVAWLKKQSEQKPTLPKWKYKNDDTPLLRDSIILNRYGGVAKSPSGAIVSDVWVLDYDELAKLPKEEKADSTNIPVLNFKAKDWYVSKVDGKIHKIHTFGEPKFKVGDWVVNNNSGGVCQVTEIRNDEYCIWPLDGEIMGYLRIIDVDKDYHLWTISDAKNGDILIYNDSIFIFNEVYGHYLIYHCICDHNKFHDDKYYSFLDLNTIDINNIHPATEEQRDTLFAKMREAGYEWNAEKKELKKIKQKSTWNAEDEKNLNAVLSFIGDEYLRRWLKDIIHKEYDE